MSDYEHIVISAVRYALGRMTYIVSLIVNYVLKDIEEKKGEKLGQRNIYEVFINR